MHPDFLVALADATERAAALAEGLHNGELLRCLGDQRLALAAAVQESTLNSAANFEVAAESAKVAAWAAVIWSRAVNASQSR